MSVKIGGTMLTSAGNVVAAPMLPVTVGVDIVGVRPEESCADPNGLVEDDGGYGRRAAHLLRRQALVKDATYMPQTARNSNKQYFRARAD